MKNNNRYTRNFISNLVEIYKEHGIEIGKNEAKNHAKVFCAAVLRTFFDGTSKINLGEFGVFYIRKNSKIDFSILFKTTPEIKSRISKFFSAFVKDNLV